MQSMQGAARIGHKSSYTPGLLDGHNEGKQDNCLHRNIPLPYAPEVVFYTDMPGFVSAYAALSLPFSKAFRNSSKNASGSAQM